jgi:hypothetical protein
MKNCGVYLASVADGTIVEGEGKYPDPKLYIADGKVNYEVWKSTGSQNPYAYKDLLRFCIDNNNYHVIYCLFPKSGIKRKTAIWEEEDRLEPDGSVAKMKVKRMERIEEFEKRLQEVIATTEPIKVEIKLFEGDVKDALRNMEDMVAPQKNPYECVRYGECPNYEKCFGFPIIKLLKRV